MNVIIMLMAGGIVGRNVDDWVRRLTLQGDLDSQLGGSLIEVHLNNHRHAVASEDKKKRVRDLDCDAIEDDIDAVETQCHFHRYDVLKSLVSRLVGNGQSVSSIQTQLGVINTTLFGDEYNTEGISDLMNVQHLVLYGGSNMTADGKTITYPGLARSVAAYAAAASRLGNQTKAVMDTAWSNFLTVTSQLKEFLGEHQTKKFMDAVAEGMESGQLMQKSLLLTVNNMKQDTADVGNNALEKIADEANAAQPGIEKRIASLEALRDQTVQTMNANLEKGSKKLSEVTDFFNSQVPSRMADYIDRLTSNGAIAVKKARDDFFSLAHDKGAQFKTEVDKLVDIFNTNSQALLEGETLDWNQAVAEEQLRIQSKQKQLSRTSEDTSANLKLEDAAELATMNDMAVNVTDTLDTAIYTSQDAILKVSDQLKKLRTSADNIGKNVKDEFNNLLQDLTDGTTNQREKVSNFLKLAADSNADELAALVQSAARMRDSLGSNQAGAYADISAFIANMQVKLAQKAQNEGSVSTDVQKALAIGKDMSDSKLSAVDSFLAGNVQVASGELKNSASDVMGWLLDASISLGGNSSLVNRDMAGAAASGSAAVAAKVELQHEIALSQIQKLRALSLAGGQGASKSLNDASVAAQAILSSLQNVRGGTASLNELMSDRSGALSEKLSAIASQLGMSDEAAAKMFANLVKTASTDADMKISSLLNLRVTSIKNRATNDGAAVEAQMNEVNALADAREEIDSRAAEASDKFQAKLGDLAQELDAGFQDRMSRDATIKTAVESGLSNTRAMLATQAKKAFDSIGANRQAMGDDAIAQLDKDIDALNVKIKAVSRTQFDRVTESLGTLNGPDSTDMIRAGTQLNQAVDSFKKFFADMSSVVVSGDSILDQVDRVFRKNASELSNSLTNSTASEVPIRLQKRKDDLLVFLKSVPRRISEQLKVIEDSFLLTDDQISQKAKILEFMADRSMTAEERTLLNHQMENLEKSKQLMSDFQVVQQQALREVFTRQSGLLGKADGTIGDLQGISNSISGMLNDNDKINDRVEQAIAKSRVDLDGLNKALTDAVSTTNTSLSREIGASANQEGFSSNISNAQIGSLIDSVNKDGSLASQTAADLQENSSEAIAEKQAKLATILSMLQDNRNVLLEAAQRTLNAANSTNDGIKAALADSAADRDQQIVIVKNAVQRLLQTWTQYSDAQNRKFARWNKTEDEYVGQFLGTLGALNSTARSDMAATERAVRDDNDGSLAAIRAFVDLQNKIDSSIERTRSAIQAMNVSTENSADQIGEQIYRLDASDKSLDDQARSTAASEAAQLESQASEQAQSILDSFHVKRTTSLLQIDTDLDDERLRSQINQLEKKLGRG